MPIKIQSHIDVLQKQVLLNLWNAAYPKQIAHANPEELDAYLLGLQNCQHYFMLDEKDKYIAWSSVFEREGT